MKEKPIYSRSPENKVANNTRNFFSEIKKFHIYYCGLIHHHHHWLDSPWWALAFLGSFAYSSLFFSP